MKRRGPAGVGAQGRVGREGAVRRGNSWLRRAPHRDPEPGDTVVETFVLARVLGVPLLTLEGRVVLSDDVQRRPALEVTPVGANLGARHQVRSNGLPPPGGALRRAAELVEQGSSTLAAARRLSDPS